MALLRTPPMASFEGVVSEVARAVDVDQRAFTVKVALPLTVTARTGTFARVFFPGAPRRLLRVPATAVRRHGQVASVFVVQEGVARLRLVQVGTRRLTRSKCWRAWTLVNRS